MYTITKKIKFVCRDCKDDKVKHKALGYCENCYRRYRYELKVAKKAVDKSLDAIPKKGRK